jgi:N-acyl-D-amino-acid deacylase
MLSSCLFNISIDTHRQFLHNRMTLKTRRYRMFDILIRNGTVVDGSGQKPFQADVAVDKGRIADVGPHLESEAREIIDARESIVSPGFIDMHSHSDFTLLVCPEAESKIRQGVTTELVGNCGGSPAPVPVERRDDFMQYMVGLGNLYKNVLTPEDWSWNTLAQFYEELESKGIALNVAPLVGHSTLRSGVMGYKSGPPTPEELDQMKRLLEIELDQGIFGMSAGLIYHPGAFADREELARLAATVDAYGGVFTVHMRSEGNALFEAIDEAIYVGEQSGASVQISHLKCENPANWGNADAALNLINEARDKGQRIDFDQYPYRAWQTGLLEIFPTWAKENGADQLIAILKDQEGRQKVVKDMTQPPYDWENPMDGLDWTHIHINDFNRQENQALEGLTVAQIAEQMGIAPVESIFRLFIEERGELSMISFSMSEDDIIKIMQQPDGMIGSDGCSVAPYGLTGSRKVHPRFYGTFPRILGRYVREKKVLSLQQAIRKMTGIPARKLNLNDRGLLKKGYQADIVVFDENKISDTATFDNPHQYPIGISFVLVNGQVVISNGEHTGRLPGKFLKRA